MHFITILILAFALTLFSSTTKAEIVVNTPNNGGQVKIEKSGDSKHIYEIKTSHGTTQQANLFYDFDSFSIVNGETAKFINDPNTQYNNVIARVTGTEASNIDGILKSDISNADFYFVNPNGILFGENSRVDVPAGLFISTADSIRPSRHITTEDQGRGVSLIVDEPASFGFLDDTLGKITIKSRNLNNEGNIHLIGGDIKIYSNDPNFDAKIVSSKGRVSIQSASGKREIQLTSATTPNNNDLIETGGSIHIKNALIKGRGEELEEASILGVSIVSDLLEISGSSQISSPSTDIAAGGIFINATNIVLSNNSKIESDTLGSADAGQVYLVSNTTSLSGNSHISSSAIGAARGAGGQVKLVGNESLLVQDNASIYSYAHEYTAGTAGNIDIKTKNLGIIGNGVPTKLFEEYLGENEPGADLQEGSALITSKSYNESKGQGGNVTITADQVKLENGGTISVGAIGGNAGEIDLNISSKLSSQNGFLVAYSAQTNGGNINITSPGIIDVKDSFFRTFALGNVNKGGDGGSISIIATNTVFQGTKLDTHSNGASGGNLTISGNLVPGPRSSWDVTGRRRFMDGEVNIDNLVNPAKALKPHELNFFDPQIKPRCSVIFAEEESTFEILTEDGSSSC